MLALSRVFMVSNNALHSGYSVCRTCARLQGHVHVAGYRLLFIGPCVAAGADARRDAARRCPRRSQEQASINSNVCPWFVRETAFNFASGCYLNFGKIWRNLGVFQNFMHLAYARRCAVGQMRNYSCVIIRGTWVRKSIRNNRNERHCHA